MAEWPMRHEMSRLQQETLAIGAVNWHMIDASETPDQSLRSARVAFL
jgi:hypothetical protein